MDILMIVFSIVIIGLLIFILLRRNTSGANSDSMDFLKNENHRLQFELTDMRNRYMEEKSKLAGTDAALNAEKNRLKEQQQYLESLQERFKLEFSLVANAVLDQHTQKFSHTTQQNLENILFPLKTNLKSFEEKVEKTYQQESADRNHLKGVIEQLMQHSQQIKNEANNLTRALKGDHKKQGIWGELILEKVLENSGLTKGREYVVQKSFQNEKGDRFQPDVVIYLPEGKNILIDAKVSLIAYEKMINAASEQEKTMFLQQHIQAIKHHIDDLSKKDYPSLYQIHTPDFILLFLPVESLFSVTIQAHQDLFQYAWNKKIVIVSPTTLLATLKTIASIWKIDHQNKNVYEIANEAGALYDKFAGFVADMEKIGKYLQLTRTAHEDAIKKLHSGQGNLVSKAEKIKKLGARTKTDRSLDTQFLP